MSNKPMPATTHEVKCWTDFFEPILSGEKTFDLRFNDRKYKVGDTLVLKEYDDRAGKFTGRARARRITYILEGIGPGCITPVKGLAREYVILALGDLVS